MSYRLIQVTDCHLLTDPNATLCHINTYQTLKNMLSHLVKEPHDALVFTGDLAQDEVASTYQHYLDLTQHWPAPIYWLPGNHDHPPSMEDVLCTEPWHTTKHVDFGPWRIILLNSHWPHHIEGQLSDAELQRLTALLDEHDGPVLLFMHHHLTYTEMGLANTAEFLNRLAPYQGRIQAIISGHVHAENDGHFEGFRHLTTPSTCFQFKMIGDKVTMDTPPPGYRVMTLHDDGTWHSEVQRI